MLPALRRPIATRHALPAGRRLLDLHRKRPRRVARTPARILVARILLLHARVQVRLQVPAEVAVHGGVVVGEVRGGGHGLGGGDLEAVAFGGEALVEELERGVLEGEAERVVGGGDFVGRRAAGDGPVEGGEGLGGRVVVGCVGVASPGEGVGGAVCLDGVEEGD